MFIAISKAGLLEIISTYRLRFDISSGTQPSLLLIKQACPSMISAAENFPIKFIYTIGDSEGRMMFYLAPKIDED